MSKRYDYVKWALHASRPGGNNAQDKSMRAVLRRLVREAVNDAIWGHINGRTDDELRHEIARRLVP